MLSVFECSGGKSFDLKIVWEFHGAQYILPIHKMPARKTAALYMFMANLLAQGRVQWRD